MADKKATLQDYILVDVAKNTGRVKLEGLDSIFLPISKGGPVEDLESEIYDLSAFLLTLSSDFAKTHESISEINDKFEQRAATDFMRVDPAYLKEDAISEMVEDANLVMKDDMDEAYEAELDEVDNKFIAVNNNIDNWFY